MWPCYTKNQELNDVHDIESSVLERYSEGARERQESLCCPVSYDNDLLARLAQDEEMPFNQQELNEMLGNYQEFTGRAAEQTAEYLQEVVEPYLEKHKDLLGGYDTSLSV